ncbi:MAG TPA: hemolysin III family protein [Thermohalobaculum sp.]|nr:hemolysin III family protein [Thermohalobaculum sp.]
MIHPVLSQAEHLADLIIHIAGIVAALIAVPVFVTVAVIWFGDASTVGAAVVYGVSLVAMLCLSACYHMARDGRSRQILRRLDHAAIYVKIAGTYTPFAVLLAPGEATPILAGIWGAALMGVCIKMISARRWEWLTLALYIIMGWSVVVLGNPILQAISATSLILMFVGGLLYTVGVVILYWNRLRFRVAIWHGMVLVASFAFYAALFVEVTRRAKGI